MAVVPRWMAKVNKRVFNPREIKKGKRPVLIHRGRKSGKEYQTPLDAHPTADGFLFIIMYGADRSDWVQNILAEGAATLRYDGDQIPLVQPSLITPEAAATALAQVRDRVPELRDKAEYLEMKRIPSGV